MAVCEDRLNVLEERKASVTVDSMGYENLKMEIEAEEAKRKRWAEEVAIKRHVSPSSHLSSSHLKPSQTPSISFFPPRIISA
jgi:hypothetical protein